ncbi:methylated-DNA--[protein]-cysteine S-methyltransferase [Corallincola luteus]|uniref:Methylated-DNA--[protein]-cysteine S-methyltransferase n=1 Tax=Corallincola luteus TaxID=1775177 RepID=A0ABY2AKC7_9GAMM|nr:methylated-DNA--[protein]-cysteine S-methyltransferase [Corallincola luteus]TCI03262.1 methylated-DNA--[protein]-cysteine S-methyltransferase [Corallincola luteus]
MPEASDTLNQRIWQVVSAIPVGTVASYGDVAKRAGLPGYARYVGRVLRNLPPSSTLPWHRVIKADGRLAFMSGSDSERRQIACLTKEGVLVRRGRVDMKRYAWHQ